MIAQSKPLLTVDNLGVKFHDRWVLQHIGFSIYPKEFKENLIYKIMDAKRFVTSMVVFVKYMKQQNISDNLDFKLTFQENMIVERLSFNSKCRLKARLWSVENCKAIGIGDPDNLRHCIGQQAELTFADANGLFLTAALGNIQDDAAIEKNVALIIVNRFAIGH